MEDFIEYNGKKLKIYKMTIDRSKGEGAAETALVDYPAIEQNWKAFSQGNAWKFEGNKDKQELWGPFMIPDFPIYRKDEEFGEYFVVFSKETVEEAWMLFKKKPIFNFGHSNKKVEATLIEDWIIEKPDTKSEKLGFNLPNGTIFGRVKVEDTEFWNEYVRTGIVRGFSVEGFMGMMAKQFKQMKKFTSYKTASGEEIFVDGEVAVDSIVYCNMPSHVLLNGTKTEIQYPYYGNVVELEDGTVLTLADSKIVEIGKKEATSAPATEKPNTQMKTKKITGFRLGKKVFPVQGLIFEFESVTAKDGTVIATVNPDDKIVQGAEVDAADGDYTLEDGTVIKVVAGKIDSITAPVAQADATATPPAPSSDWQAAIDEMKSEILAAITALSDRVTALETGEQGEDATAQAEYKKVLSDVEDLKKKSQAFTSVTSKTETPSITGRPALVIEKAEQLKNVLAFRKTLTVPKKK